MFFLIRWYVLLSWGMGMRVQKAQVIQGLKYCIWHFFVHLKMLRFTYLSTRIYCKRTLAAFDRSFWYVKNLGPFFTLTNLSQVKFSYLKIMWFNVDWFWLNPGAYFITKFLSNDQLEECNLFCKTVLGTFKKLWI